MLAKGPAGTELSFMVGPQGWASPRMAREVCGSGAAAGGIRLAAAAPVTVHLLDSTLQVKADARDEVMASSAQLPQRMCRTMPVLNDRGLEPGIPLKLLWLISIIRQRTCGDVSNSTPIIPCVVMP